MKKFLSEFKGRPLTEEEVALGLHLCYRNAKEILGDAKLLKKNGRYARALSLAILALEEIGKIPLLFKTLTFSKDDKVSWRKFWKTFSSHQSKLLVWGNYGKIFEKLGKKHYAYKYDTGMVPLINKFKQLGFYTSYFKDQFITPKRFAGDNIAWVNWIFAITGERIKDFSILYSTLKNSKKFTKGGKNMASQLLKVKTEKELKEIIRKIIREFRK